MFKTCQDNGYYIGFFGPYRDDDSPFWGMGVASHYMRIVYSTLGVGFLSNRDDFRLGDIASGLDQFWGR